MTQRTVDAPSIVSAYDWGVLGHVVDVGGGDGTLLIALLDEYPPLNGTVVDLPATAETARRMFEAAGVSDRARAVAGDFLAERAGLVVAAAHTGNAVEIVELAPR